MKRAGQKGMTLMEMSFVVAIGVILAGLAAGAGNFLNNEASLQYLVQEAKRYEIAIDKHMQAKWGGTYPWPSWAPGTTMTAGVLDTWLGPPSRNCGVFAYMNGVSGGCLGPTAYAATADGGYAVHTVFGQMTSAAYPLDGQGGRPDLRGTILYLYSAYPNAAYQPGSFWVWRGASDGKVRQYALQAIDDRGYAMITLSH